MVNCSCFELQTNFFFYMLCQILVQILQKEKKNQKEIEFLTRILFMIPYFKQSEQHIKNKKSKHFVECIKEFELLSMKQHDVLFSYGDMGRLYYYLVSGNKRESGRLIL